MILHLRKLVTGLIAFFLFQPEVLSQAPGGVTASPLKLWFKADAGVHHTNGQVSQWDDISAAGFVTVQPKKTANAHVTYNTSKLNFNPGVFFDGTRLELLQGNADNLGGSPTLFAVTRNVSISDFHPIIGNSIYYSRDNNPTGPGIYLGANYYVADGTESWINSAADAPASVNQVDMISLDYLDAASTSNTRMFKNGVLTEFFTGAGKPNTSDVKLLEIGGRSAADNLFPNRIFHGDIAEVVYFTNYLDATDRQKVESYLAIKYGITLGHNYFSSANTVIYDVASYNHQVIGIGRDDASALYQKQSRGENYVPILTIALNNIAANNQSNTGTFSADRTSFITGSDNGSFAVTNTGVPPGVYNWLERKWKSTLTGGPVNNLVISIPENYLTGFAASCDMILIMADDAGFTSNVQTYTMTKNGSDYQAVISTLTAGTRYFTFGKNGYLDFDFNYKQDICNPLQIQFFNAGTSNTDPYWDFGDGTTLTNELSPVHSFAAYGNYTARFAVQNATCADTVEKIISVQVKDEDLILTADTTLCNGLTKQLRTKPVLNFCWSPTTYLDDPSLPNPTSSAPQKTTYYFTGEAIGNNLITNGDFSAGNTGFTTDYQYVTSNVLAGQYYTGTSAQGWNPSLSNCISDHTTGTGNMLLVNGSANTNLVVWTTTVPITPNTNYAFSMWITDICWGINPARLRFSINGKPLGSLIAVTAAPCIWSQFYTTWNSGANTTATISIINENTAASGNDFAIDDISFAPVTIIRDSVVIDAGNIFVSTNNDTTLCADGPVQLMATGADTYSWSPATGLSDASIANPVAKPTTRTEYIVSGTTAIGCEAKDTVVIDFFTKPVITVTDDLSVCINSSVNLSVTGGTSYRWTPAISLDDPNIANPVATPTDSTNYKVEITDANNCKYNDSVIVDIIPRPGFYASPGATLCDGDTLTMNAGGGDNYAWTPALNISNASSANPTAWPNTTTDYSVHISENTCNYDTTINVRINVNPKPALTIQKANDIDCITTTARLQARGALSYSWTPVSAVDNPGVASPLVSIDTTTVIAVRGINEFGCFASDSIAVVVSKTGKPLYRLPNAFTPNGDRVNDCFGIRKWGTVDLQEFAIFNRWGQLIFSTKNATQCWDGTLNGHPQPTGTYVYKILAQSFCGEIIRSGVIMLIR